MAADHSDNGRTPQSYSLERQDDLLTELDPHLQNLLLAHAAGESGAGAGIVTSQDGQLRVDVIAKLRNPGESVPGLEVVRSVEDLVTGTVAIPDIEKVRSHANVESLKAATTVHKLLDLSVPEVRCDAQALRDAFPGLDPGIDGANVVVGIVDYGCDFRHGNFRKESGETRLVYLWDQRRFNVEEGREVRSTAPAPAGYGYGREFDAAALNAALATQNPFRTLDYELEFEEHGTHVMDIAAGNGRATGRPGVAPAADLIFVHLDTGDISGEGSLGNSRRLLEAVEYIFAKAGDRPAVVNLSLGTYGGPHDGTTPVEQWFDKLLNKKGRAVVIAAGNSHDLKSHAHGTIQPGQTRTLSWEILLDDRTPNELEVWYGGDSPLEIALVLPGGQARLGPVPLGETHVIRRSTDDRKTGQIIHRKSDPSNGDHHIDVLLGSALPRGTWGVELSNRGSQEVAFHAWIERDDGGQSQFAAADQTASFTLGSISCGKATIAVGAYDARTRGLPVFTAAGPTRDGREKPDVSAPGLEVRAASSRGDSVRKSGTSMAAPHVAGLAALLLGRDGSLTAREIGRRLRESARRSAGASGHHPRFGFGRIDGVEVLRTVVSIQPPVAAAMVQQAGAGMTVPVDKPNGHAGITALLAQSLTGTGTFRISVQVEPVDRP